MTTAPASRPAQKTLSPLAWTLLLALAFIWGGTFLANRFALLTTPPAWITATRVTLAVPVLWAAALLTRQPMPKGWRTWGALLVMGALNNVLPFTLIAWGQAHVPSSLAAILNSSTALWGMGLAALVFADERMTRAKAVGLALGFSGVVLVIGPSALGGLDLRALGQLSVIGATLSYAVAGIWARKMLSGLPPLTSAAGMLTGAALLALPLAWSMEGPPGGVTLPSAIALLYLALLATALAFIFYYRLMATAGTGYTMLATLLVAPVGVALGAVVLGESLSPQAWGGFALIVLGLLTLNGRIRLARARPSR
ncbi:DMT family transporter [Pseudoroseicyclus tamaricis]|nr:DMT family transporter [Pseudoroseicyclus tamaricis]